MKIAISTAHSGKNPPGLSGDAQNAWFGWYNGTFSNFQFTAVELANEIQKGHGYTTPHKNYRKAANFICGQHLGLDYDDLPGGTTLEQVYQSDPFITDHAAILHTTASHTAEKTKARVIFQLDLPIRNAEKYGLLAASLLHYFGGEVDPKTKDPARLFFGAAGCQVLIPGNVLTLETAAEELVKPYLAYLEQQAKDAQERAANRVVVPAADVPARLLEVHSQKLLDRIATAADGEKYYTLRDISRTFGGYVEGGYYPARDVTQWLQNTISARPSVKDLKHAFKTIEQGIEHGRLSPLHFELTPQGETRPADDFTIRPDLSWREATIADRRKELEALITEIEPTEPAFLPAVAEYYRLDDKEPPAAVLEGIAQAVNNA